MQIINERITSFDYLKGIAIFFVVCIHSALFFGLKSEIVDYNQIGFIINTAARFAVPFFFVSAGFLFMEKVKSAPLLNYYFKYILKVAKYYLIWSIIYLVFGAYEAMMTNISIEAYLNKSLAASDIFYYGKLISEPLWFLPALIFAVTIVSVAIKYNFDLILLIISFFLYITGLFGFSQNYYIFYNLDIFTRDGVFFGLFFVTMGVCFSKKDFHKKNLVKAPLLLTIFFVFLVVQQFERYYLVEKNNFTVFGDYYLATVPLTIALFLYALAKPYVGKNNFITKIGKQAVGIYLIHSLIIQLCEMAGILSLRQYPVWHLLFAPFVWIFSYYAWIACLRLISYKKK